MNTEERFRIIQKKLGGYVSSQDWHTLGFNSMKMCSMWIKNQRDRGLLSRTDHNDINSVIHKMTFRAIFDKEDSQRVRDWRLQGVING